MNKNTQNIDSKVLELFNKVKEKQNKITKNEKVNWETNCSFGFNSEVINDRFNLQVTTDLVKLVDAHVFLQTKIKNWAESCELLGVKIPLKWLGYPPGDWQKDIKTRIGQLQLNNEKKELATLEARLDALITVDQRREMELDAISKLVD